jgi:hypothetical protein
MKKRIISIIILVILAIILGLLLNYTKKVTLPIPLVTSFELCVEAGNPVMESFPRQCNSDGKTFVEDVGNELSKINIIHISSPRPGESISSPVIITGQARGNWFFEASFPVMLTDWDGRIIAEGIAQPQNGENWMTTEFVPFEAKLEFTIDDNIYSRRGTLILKKDNPSGLPENDDALEIPVVFGDSKIEPI